MKTSEGEMGAGVRRREGVSWVLESRTHLG